MTRDELVLAHMPLARGIAKRYRYYRDKEDLEQEAILGLLIAAQKWDPNRGFLFSTYAQWWCRVRVSEFLIRNQSAVTLNPAVPKDERAYGSVELDEGIRDRAPLPDEVLIEKEEREHTIRVLLKACKNERERTLLNRRWLSDEGALLVELGEIFGISQERVRQVESALFRRFRGGVDIEKLVSV